MKNKVFYKGVLPTVCLQHDMLFRSIRRTYLDNNFSNTFSLYQLEKTPFYKQCWPYMFSIQRIISGKTYNNCNLFIFCFLIKGVALRREYTCGPAMLSRRKLSGDLPGDPPLGSPDILAK